METITEAKDFLNENYKDGCICPCCNQTVKLYKRKLNSGMAKALIIMLKLHKNNPNKNGFKMNMEIAKMKIPSSNIEYSKLKYWGLVQELKDEDATPGAKTSGVWKLTQKGKDFTLGKITVPTHVNIYNKIKYGYSEEHTNIIKALGNHFDYNELMN